MNITIQHGSGTPIYLQMKNQIKDMILKGTVAHGSALPSERAMAKVADVHRNTVVRAYSELKADGLIEAVRGKGYRVSLPGDMDEGAESRTSSISWERLIRPEVLYQDTAFDDFFFRSYTGKDHISFAGGITPTEAYGRDALTEILTELIADSEDIYAYTPYQGLKELRQELSSFLAGKGISAKWGEIQMVSESNQALDYFCQMFLTPGDCVLTEEPGSPDVFREFSMAGARIVTVPVDSEGMVTEQVEMLIRRHEPKLIYVNPSFQDPTGSVMSLERRKTLLELSYRYQVPIIEDDSASELDYEGVRPPSLKALDTLGSVLYIYSFALTFAPGVGMGFVTAPRPVIKRFSHLISMRLINLDSLSQRILTRYFQKGSYQKNRKEICRIYGTKRDLMYRLLQPAKDLGVVFQRPQGGVYIWCRLPVGMDEKQLIRKAGQKGVTFIPGSVFYPGGTAGDQFIRLNYSYPELAQIEKGVPLLIEAMRESLAGGGEDNLL